MNLLTTGLEIWLHGRKGQAGHFSGAHLAQIRRTLDHTQEVFVGMSSGGKTRAAVKSDIAYIGQSGRAEIETDTGEVLHGPEAPEQIVDRWDIDLARGLGAKRQSVSLTLALPAGTPPVAVLAAGRQFATEHFSPNFRWALALHTDKPHPHVHIVVKAEGRDGKRLRIVRETLRDYRLSFAEKMRAQGVPANATLQAARGQFRKPQDDRAINHLQRRGKSTVIKTMAVDALRDLATGATTPDPAKPKLLHIRHDVMLEWARTIRQLQAEGHTKLAADAGRFVAGFEPVRTPMEKMKEKAREHLRERIKENRGLDANRDALTR